MIEIIYPFNFILAWISYISAGWLYYTENKLANWFALIAVFNLLLSIISI